MKKGLYIIVFFALLFSACGPAYVTVQNTPPPPQAPPPQPQPEEVSYQTFYDDLSPYGQWIDYPGYGYVWMPDAGPDFKPYATNGHWVYSDAGWVWASDYQWGWATFHYGRWFYEQGYGWMWIPGNEWAPAWVSWRRSDDYYGWAPLGPNVTVGVAISSYNPPNNYWCFVPHQYVSSPHVNNYYVNETKNVTIINNTTVINNTVINNNITNNRVNNTTVNNNVRNNFYAAGPDANEVSRATGTTIRPVAIAASNRPGQTQVNNGQLSIFRPRVNAAPATGSNNGSGNNNSRQRFAPASVKPFNNIRQTGNTSNPANTSNGNNVENRNNAAPPANNNSAQPRPNEPSVNTKPVTATTNQPPPTTAMPPVVQNTKPVTAPNNNQPVITKPANITPPVNNTNPPNNRFTKPNNTAPVNGNSSQNRQAGTNPGATNTNHTVQQQQVQSQNNTNPRPAPQQNNPNLQRKPAVVKPPVVNKDDKKDKPKPPVQ